MYFSDGITNTEKMSCISKIRAKYTDVDKKLAKTFAQRANVLANEERKDIYDNKLSRYSWIKSQKDFNSEIFEGYVNNFKKTSYFKILSKKKSSKKHSKKEKKTQDAPKKRTRKKKATKTS